MAFLSILKRIENGIGVVLGTVEKVEPTVTALLPELAAIPVFGPLAAEVIPLAFNTVNSLETLVTGVQQGQAKGTAALAILQAQLPNLDSVEAAIGKDAKLSPAALNAVQPMINGAVALANAVAAFQAELKPAVPTV